MLDCTPEYLEAVVGDARETLLLVVVDVSDPDKQFLPTTGSAQAPWSKIEELHDKNFDSPPPLATLELNRWMPGADLFPDDFQVDEHVGYAGAALSDESGHFAAPQWTQLNFANVSVIQAFSVFFSDNPFDGVPEEFTVEVLHGNTAYFQKEVSGNSDTAVSFDGFTVYDPTAIRITVTKWSLPFRRMRVTEILMGIYERWTADDLSEFSLTQQGDFSCLTLPYGLFVLGVDNQSRRFEPRRKNSLFESIEEQQGIEPYIGVKLPSGAVEYKHLGFFYQSGDGWKTSDNSMKIKWSLVDIIGLLANRTFIPPESLPTTLAGWIEAVVTQLGPAFTKRWHVDPDYADAAVTANSSADVTGKSCGDIIRWSCMAAGCWPRADAETGRLTAEPLWSQGNKITLDNLEQYPTMQANKSLAALIFQLADGTTGGTQHVITGNSVSSENTVTVQNPFIHTPEQARTASRLILAQYGGNIIETVGRGDPAGEIGDVDVIWLDESRATTARRESQTLQYADGVLRSCRSMHLQADGSYLWTEFALITESGTWKSPPGKTELLVIVGQGGQGGGYGADGKQGGGMLSPTTGKDTVSATFTGDNGEPGKDGAGGKVWYGLIRCNPEQEFSVVIGEGGEAATAQGQDGAQGGETSFGAYTSADGKYYENGYSVIANGDSFGRSGVAMPLPNSSDGGKGGLGGRGGVTQTTWVRDPDSIYGGGHETVTVISNPTPGTPGVDGASGFVLVFWDKEAVSA